mgnify:CR=1 FL=1
MRHEGFAIILEEVIVSIHAPVQGATMGLGDRYFMGLGFNPRTRAGCDTNTIAAPGMVYAVSIHAPVQGATSAASVVFMAGDEVSIHAPVQGATK